MEDMKEDGIQIFANRRREMAMHFYYDKRDVYSLYWQTGKWRQATRGPAIGNCIVMEEKEEKNEARRIEVAKDGMERRREGGPERDWKLKWRQNEWSGEKENKIEERSDRKWR